MDAPARSAIGSVVVSLTCCGFVLMVLEVRGSSDWSRALAVVFYSALAGAFFAGITGLVLAMSSSLPRDTKRVLAVLSLVGITCPVWLLIAIVSLVSQMR